MSFSSLMLSKYFILIVFPTLTFLLSQLVCSSEKLKTKLFWEFHLYWCWLMCEFVSSCVASVRTRSTRHMSHLSSSVIWLSVRQYPTNIQHDIIYVLRIVWTQRNPQKFADQRGKFPRRIARLWAKEIVFFYISEMTVMKLLKCILFCAHNHHEKFGKYVQGMVSIFPKTYRLLFLFVYPWFHFLCLFL